MAAGLLVSLFGSSVSIGVLPGAIAVGALSLVWLPVLQTVQTLEEFTSPLVARFMRGRDPGTVLVGCEAADAALCVGSLTVIATTSIDNYTVFLAYFLSSSALPVFIDVAEELFTGEIARVDQESALRFNVMIYSMIGFMGAFVARPVGSLLAGVAVAGALSVNAIASIGGLLLRFRAVRLLPKGWNGAQSLNGAFGVEGHRSVRIGLRQVLATRSPGSPVVSGLLAMSAAVVAGYLVQWAARDTARPAWSVAVLLLGVGAGATIGPHVARLLARDGRDVAAARQILLFRIGVLVAVVPVAGTTADGAVRLLLSLILLTLLTGGVVASVVVQATSRQVRYSGDRLGQMVGWSHAASAAGSTLGSWCGLVLSVDEKPVAGAGVAAVVAVVALARLREADT